MTLVKAGGSVFWECQELLRIWRQEHTQRPAWLILGDDEYARLLDECSALVPAGSQAPNHLTGFQGVNVAHFAVPSYIQVIA